MPFISTTRKDNWIFKMFHRFFFRESVGKALSKAIFMQYFWLNICGCREMKRQELVWFWIFGDGSFPVSKHVSIILITIYNNIKETEIVMDCHEIAPRTGWPLILHIYIFIKAIIFQKSDLMAAKMSLEIELKEVDLIKFLAAKKLNLTTYLWLTIFWYW